MNDSIPLARSSAAYPLSVAAVLAAVVALGGCGAPGDPAAGTGATGSPASGSGGASSGLGAGGSSSGARGSSSGAGGSSSSGAGGSPGAGQKKDWHPGYYVQNWRDASHFNDQSTRFAEYDEAAFANDSHIAGAVYFFPWSQLEGASHGDYAAGKALIHAELDHLKALAKPKRLIIQMLDEPNYSFCGSQACQQAYFPTYIQTAGCLTTNPDPTGGLITHFVDWNPTCRQYLIDFINAYGAEFNGEPTFEGFGYPYERIIQGSGQCCGYDAGSYDTATREIAAAMRAAFPNKNVFMAMNWYIDQPHIISLTSYLTSIGVGWGQGDTWEDYYTDANKVTVGMIGGHDYRGEAPLFWKVEATELGYTGTGDEDGVRGYTATQLYDVVNNQMGSQYFFVERNIFTGANASRWYACNPDAVPFANPDQANRSCSQTSNPGGLLNLIDSTPLTHTACPTSYDTLFGDGSAGSGCKE